MRSSPLSRRSGPHRRHSRFEPRSLPVHVHHSRWGRYGERQSGLWLGLGPREADATGSGATRRTSLGCGGPPSVGRHTAHMWSRPGAALSDSVRTGTGRPMPPKTPKRRVFSASTTSATTGAQVTCLKCLGAKTCKALYVLRTRPYLSSDGITEPTWAQPHTPRSGAPPAPGASPLMTRPSDPRPSAPANRWTTVAGPPSGCSPVRGPSPARHQRR